MKRITRKAIKGFCLEFLECPYLCYTEHGLHALFFSRLFSAIPERKRFVECMGERVCIVQKEYPTADKLGKPRRQHWDISVIKSPVSYKRNAARPYDFLKLESVIEFGLNEDLVHVKDDILRMSHENSNVEHGFAVHLHRLSGSGELFSGRDWSPRSKRIVEMRDLVRIAKGKPVEVYYAMVDSTRKRETGLWVIGPGDKIKKLSNA